MTNVSGKNTSEQGAAVSSGREHGLDDGPVDRPSGAIEDGIVSSTADPDKDIEYGGGETVPPGDAEPVLPPYEDRKKSTDGSTPGRGENDVSRNTGTASNQDDESTKLTPGSGSGDEGAGQSHTPGTGRAEDKL